MVSIGIPSYVAEHAYAYQRGNTNTDVTDRALALEENQAFATKLFYAMRTKETAEEEKAESADAQVAPEVPVSTLVDALEENTVLSCILKMREKMGDMYKKVLSGSTEPSFRIGGSTFTLKEWDEFLSRFDTVEEAYRAAMRAEYETDERMHATRTNAAASSIVNDPKKAKAVLDPAVSAVEPLLSESVRSSYPPESENDKPKQFITWFNEDGVFCREQGKSEGYLWNIQLFDKDSLNRIISFIDRFDTNTNMRFAAQESFWRDFLANKIDEDDYVNRYAGTNNNMPVYL